MAQLKIQVHFLTSLATASVFSAGVILFIYDFFRHRPNFQLTNSDEIAPRAALPREPV